MNERNLAAWNERAMNERNLSARKASVMNESGRSSSPVRGIEAAVRVATLRVVTCVGIVASLAVGALAARTLAQTNSGETFSPFSVRGGTSLGGMRDAVGAPPDSVKVAALAADTAASAPASALMLAARDLTFVAAASLPPGATQAMLRTDPETGGIERFIRFPAGLEIAAHWHSASETVLLLEGDLTFAMEGENKVLAPGSYCFVPARTVHEARIGPAGALIYQRTAGPPDRHLVSEEGSPK
jgi:mannose-6-phosphate isomerase-like protein (cupin superfamily)